MSSDIAINNEKLITLTKAVRYVQVSIEMIQEKIKKFEKRSDKEKQKNIGHFENIVGDNKKLKDKLREIED